MENKENDKKGKRRKRTFFGLLFRLLAVLFVLIVVIVLSTPLVVSSGLGKVFFKSKTGERISVPVELESFSMNWKGGVALEGLRIDQPEGFGAGPLLQVDSIFADIGILKLLSGIFKLTVRVKGVKLNVVRDKDGKLNLQEIVAREKRISRKGKAGKGPGKAAGEEEGPPPLHVDFVIEDCRINLKDMQKGQSGRVDVLVSASNRKPGDPMNIRAMLSLFTPKNTVIGKIEVKGNLSLDGNHVDISADTRNMDISAFNPLLPALKGIDTISGILDMKVGVKGSKDKAKADGKIVISDLGIGGDALGPVPLKLKKIEVVPGVGISLENGLLDVAGFSVKSDFFEIKGIPGAKAKEILEKDAAVGFSVEIFPGRAEAASRFLPQGAVLSGRLGITAALEPKDTKTIAFLVEGKDLGYADNKMYAEKLDLRGKGVVRLEDVLNSSSCEMDLKGLSFKAEGNELKDIDARLSVDKGVGEVEIRGIRINGGKGKGRLSLGLAEKERVLKAEFDLQSALLNPSISPVLAYVLPFAISRHDAMLSGKASLSITLEGKLPQGKPDVIEMLGACSGKGDLRISDLSFRGAPELEKLLAMFREKGAYLMKNLSTSFDLKGKRIFHKGIKIKHKGKTITVTGSTGLDGTIDYAFDLSEVLKDYKKGRKLLSFLGSENLPVRLKGTVSSPKPEIKALDLKKLLLDEKSPVKKKLEEKLHKKLDDLWKKVRRKK